MVEKLNKSAMRALDVLSLLARAEGPLTITEISKALGIPKSSTFELVYTLVHKQYLQVHDKNLKNYKIGIKTFEAGAAYLSKADLHTESRPLLEKMSLTSGETVFLAVEDNGDVVYLDKVEGPRLIRTTAVLGSRYPMHCTGLGKALLAAYPEDRVKEITGGGQLLARTEFSITRFSSLLEDLAETRKRGFSIDMRESEVDVCCVAAPIYNSHMEPIAAISIAALATNYENTLNSYSLLVTKTALEISKRLGYVGDKLYP
ncbi:IclR family transcriptional regulator [Desulfitibacter alkalitolerans]|uniref:IclR family transcriptional regulator n=1 Tax=Desulfitibacter alkalitolerans TaxID=264641 RepID=UPI0005507DE0|nr:IclR family transcriptional regulator [Desulfitibacter alkalitolerans]